MWGWDWTAVGSIAGAVGAVVAVIALFVAAGANRRAKDANDLQKRLDDREREFRDVRWKLEWMTTVPAPDGVRVQLSNVGLSDAMKVTLVISLLGGDDAFWVGDLARGASREIVVSDPDAELGVLVAAAYGQRRPPWRVHWSSPMGAAASYENIGAPQIF